MKLTKDMKAIYYVLYGIMYTIYVRPFLYSSERKPRKIFK